MILLLVGPKGAGKTYLGKRTEERLGIPFLRVEPIWLELINKHRLAGEALDAAGQQRVFDEVKLWLGRHGRVSIESTGAAPWFGDFVARLEGLGRVVKVKLEVPLDVCLKRVQTRDLSEHIPVSDDRVMEINKMAVNAKLNWDLVYDNSGKNADHEFFEQLGGILRKCQAPF